MSSYPPLEPDEPGAPPPASMAGQSASDAANHDHAPFLPIAAMIVLALLGCVLGGIGLYVANQNRNLVASLEAQLVDRDAGAEALGEDTAALARRLVALEAALASQEEELAAMSGEVNRAVQTLRQEIQRTRDLIGQRTAGAPTTTAPPSAAVPVPPVLSGQTYTVQPGDTLGRIARDHGVSLRALQDANPGVDPRRLQIGQVLQLPAP